MDRAGLEAFLRQSEGQPPPVFKGREGILTTLRALGEGARTFIQEPGHTKPRVHLHGVPKTTQIVQGAPGAGKSSILVKLQEEYDASEDESAPRVLIVSSQEVIEDLSQVIQLIGVAGGLSPKKWRALPQRVSLGLNVSQIVDVTGELEWAKKDLKPMKTLRDLIEVFPRMKWTSPVVVAVDESQRLSGDDSTSHARFLQSIHDASSGLPLTLVLAGLSDTKERMEDIGITARSHNPHSPLPGSRRAGRTGGRVLSKVRGECGRIRTCPAGSGEANGRLATSSAFYLPGTGQGILEGGGHDQRCQLEPRRRGRGAKPGGLLSASAEYGFTAFKTARWRGDGGSQGGGE